VSIRRALQDDEATGGVDLSQQDEATIVVAWGRDEGGPAASLVEVSAHDADSSGSVRITLRLTGDSGLGGDLHASKHLLAAHIVLMSMAWLLALPAAGVCDTLARARRVGPLKARLTAMTNFSLAFGAILSTIGFVIGSSLTASNGGRHAATAHQVLGLVTGILPVALVVLSVVQRMHACRAGERTGLARRVLGLFVIAAPSLLIPLGAVQTGSSAPLAVMGSLFSAGMTMTVAWRRRPGRAAAPSSNAVVLKPARRRSSISGLRTNPVITARLNRQQLVSVHPAPPAETDGDALPIATEGPSAAARPSTGRVRNPIAAPTAAEDSPKPKHPSRPVLLNPLASRPTTSGFASTLEARMPSPTAEYRPAHRDRMSQAAFRVITNCIDTDDVEADELRRVHAAAISGAVPQPRSIPP